MHTFFLFAEAAPTDVNGWLSSFFWLAGGVLVILKIVDHFKEKPPLDKQLATFRDEVYALFATKQHVDDAIGRVETKIDEREEKAIEFRKELRDQMVRLGERLSERSGAIYDALRSLGREVSHLEGRLSKSGPLTKPGGST